MKQNGFNRPLFYNRKRLLFTAHDLIDMVCDYLDAPREEVFSTSRKPHLVYPRHICFYLLTELSDLSDVTIAKFFGLHASTVWKARQVVANQLRYTVNPRYLADTDYIIKKLTSL